MKFLKTYSVSNSQIEQKDFYLNENGLMVLTEAYHLQRGYCCGNGCLHCPYEYNAVAEPQKTYLLQGKNKILQGRHNPKE